MKKLQRELLPILALLLLPLLLYWDVTIGGNTMLPVDNLYQWQPWATYSEEMGASVPHNSLLSDLILQNYAWKQFTLDSLSNGEIPLWSPNLFAGAPFLANGQHGMLYPFSILFFIMPLAKAYGWFTLSQLWLAGVSGYLFGRILNLRRRSSLITGLIYQGSGFLLVSSAVFPMILASAVWLPFLLGCIEKIIERKKAGNTLPWVLAGSVGLGMNILAGHPEITYYTLLIMAFYATWRLGGILITQRQFQPLLHPSTWLSLMVALGLLIGAIQLVPSVALAQTNFREGSATLAEVRGWAFPLRRVLTLALPNFFGNPAHHTYTDIFTGTTEPFTTNFYGNPNPHGANSSNWGIKNYVEGGIYLGILPLILAVFGIRYSVFGIRITDYGLRITDYGTERFPTATLRRTHNWFFIVLGFFSLNFIFGTPLYALLYYGLPFINQLHSPFRWVFALSLCVAVLAGMGMEAVEKREERKEESQSFSIFSFQFSIANLLIVGGLAVVAGLFFSRIFYESLRPIIERVFLGLAQAPDAFDSAETFYSYLFPQLLTLALLILLSGLILRIPRRRVAPSDNTVYRIPLFFLLITADLFLANRGFHASVDPALLDFKPQLVEWLEAQEGDWRITSFDPHGSIPFHANSGWLFGLDDIRGYDSIINRQYTEYMAAIEPQNELPFNRIQPIKNWESLNSPLLDLLGVKYIITQETVELPKLQEVWTGEGVRVYENLAVGTRTYTLPLSAGTDVGGRELEVLDEFDARTIVALNLSPTVNFPPTPATLTPATITHSSNLEVRVDAVLDDAGWLVLNDSYAEGWRVFVRPLGGSDNDEQEVELLRANSNFRAVQLEAGEWTVRFRYSPRAFILGGLASFMGGILVVFSGGVWLWRRFYRPPGEMTNIQSLAKNSVVPMALNLFNKGIDFAFAMFYLRVLGPAESGAYATAITIAVWFDIVANWGLNALIIRDVAQDRSQASRYLFNTSILRLFTMLIGTIPVMIFVGESFVNGDPMPSNILWAIGLIAVGMVFSGVGQGVAGLFYAFESAEYPAMLSTVTTILKVAFGVAVLLAGWGFVGLAGVSILTNLITLVLLTVVAFRQFNLTGPWQFDLDLQKSAFKVGYPLMLNHLLATVFFKIDQPLLYRLDGEDAVGWYNSAYKWVDAFNIIPSFFTFALFPIISRQVNSNIADARRTFRMSVKLLVLVALPLAATVTLLADVMIGTLGGDQFLPDGAIALRLVMWSIPIGWINSVTNYMIVSLGLERRLTWGFLIGVTFNTVGNILLIPHFSYVAAAITTIASELILLIMFNYYLRQRIEKVEWTQLLWRPVAVTVAMVGAMWAGSQVHLLVGLLIGVLVYPLGLWVLRVFGDEERQIVAKIVPQRLAHRLN